MNKTQVSEAQQTLLSNVMETINAGIPAGYIATNKKPVQKEIRSLNSATTETLWSSWCKDENGNRYLAIVTTSGRVKLIKQEDLSNYKLRSI